MLVKRAVKVCIVAIVAAIIAGPPVVFAETLESQRRDYLAAKRALANNQITKFNALADSLQDYPLYPYLEYYYLKPRLSRVKAADMVRFFDRYGDLPVAAGLRAAWLRRLAKQGHWQSFLDHYLPQQDATLQCYQLQARIMTGNDRGLLEDTRTLWLAGKSLPDQCDPAFERLYKSDLMSDELVWQRIRLAMQNDQPRLAGYLARRLGPEYQPWAKIWMAMHSNSVKGTHQPIYDDLPIAREILIHGIKRLAERHIAVAINRWQALQKNYAFMPEVRAETDKILAVNAAKRSHPMAVTLLDRLDHNRVDAEVFRWRLRTALNLHDWRLLRRWTQAQPTEEEFALRWQYWHARALEQTGDVDQARRLYEQVAASRDYYGFIAADRINAPYRMNHVALPRNRLELERIANLPAMRRAYEFYRLDMLRSAGHEWRHVLKGLSDHEMQTAARLAAQWDWHNRSIMTLAKARAYDRLVLRFPLVYEGLLNTYAKKRGLDPSWMFGLIRAESAFIEDVKSPAGALGLMQVMPKTGKQTAARIGLKGFTSGKLKQAKTNVQIGSAYLKMMLDRFKGNMVLATAAYNAGPHRVATWLAQIGTCEASDVWIDTIPFNETRKYVRRVLYFTSIYDWRRRAKVIPIAQRMTGVGGGEQALTSGAICSSQYLSKVIDP